MKNLIFETKNKTKLFFDTKAKTFITQDKEDVLQCLKEEANQEIDIVSQFSSIGILGDITHYGIIETHP